MRLISTCFRTLLLIASVALLSACGYTTEQEVRSFIDTERAALHPVSKVIPAPKPFQAAVYEEVGKPDPFSKQAFVQALIGTATSANYQSTDTTAGTYIWVS